VSEAQLVQAADAPTEIEIVGGQQAQVGEFPWQAWFTYRGSDGNTYSCGGSLIHRQWVLTAAHCIGRMGTVILGAHNINRSSENGRQEIAIEQIIVHPRYGQNNLDSDIALLKLRQPATLNSRVAVVPLIAASGQGNLVSAGTTSTISGWGMTRPNRTQPASVLLKARVPLVSNHTCELAHGSSIVTNNMLCAGFASGGVDSCGGDSGGALVVPNGSGSWIQAGIVSWGGELCAQRNSYGVYTRVSRYINWIGQYVPLPSSPTPTPVSGDRYENDNTSSRATTISTNGNRQTHNFHIGGDADWLKFNATQGVQYVVETLNLGSQSDTKIWTYSPGSRNSFASNDDSSGSRASRISFRAGQSGTYSILVRHYSSSAGGANTNYDIRVRTIGISPDQYESDNSRSQAKSISTNGNRQRHNFHANGDVDWVKFTTTANKIYTIETLNLGNNNDTVIRLYDRNGNYLGMDDDGGSGRASKVRLRTSGSATFYVKVNHHSSSTSGTGTEYDVRITAENDNSTRADGYENDNGIGQAKSISTNNSRQTRNAHRANDVDWVKFYVRSGNRYIVETSNLGSRSDTIIHLYDNNGNYQFSNDDSGPGRGSRLIFRVNFNGYLYLKMQQYSGSVYGNNTHYDLRVRISNSNAGTIAPAELAELLLEPSTVTLSSVYPNMVENTQEKFITLNGDNLTADKVKVYLDDIELTKTVAVEGELADENHITALVPAGLKLGTYDVTLVDEAGNRTTLPDSLVITGQSQEHRVYLPVIR